MAAITQADAVGLGLLLALLVIGAVLTLPSIGDALARFKRPPKGELGEDSQ